MEEMVFLVFKSFTSILILFVLSKLMGRKQVGQLNIFDYIIGISIGSIAAEMSLNKDVSFITFQFSGIFPIHLTPLSFILFILLK